MLQLLSFLLMLIPSVIVTADDPGYHEISTNRVLNNKANTYETESEPPMASTTLCSPPIEEGFNDNEGTETSNGTDYLYVNKFMFHSIDWADLRMPAPAAIGLMGSLLLSTRQYDPWLTNVKNDTSFSSKLLSASVVQITKGAYRSFLDAHTSFDSTIRKRFGEISISEAILNIVKVLIEDKKEEQIEIIGNITMIKELVGIMMDRANYTFYSFNQVQFFFEELHIACVEQSRSDTSFELTLTIEKLEALTSHMLKVTKFFHSVAKLYDKWSNKIWDFVRSIETVMNTPAHHDRKAIYTYAYLALMQEHRVNHVSGTYVEISEKYFLSALSDARALWGIDPASLQYELAQIHLATFALLTPADIQEIISKERERFREGNSLGVFKQVYGKAGYVNGAVNASIRQMNLYWIRKAEESS